jgi:hypothetical protein
LARRGFYEDYQEDGLMLSKTTSNVGQREKRYVEQRERPAMIRKNMGTAVIGLFAKLFTAILYLAATALSSVGLTTLINKPLRDLLFETVANLFIGN